MNVTKFILLAGMSCTIAACNVTVPKAFQDLGRPQGMAATPPQEPIGSGAQKTDASKPAPTITVELPRSPAVQKALDEAMPTIKRGIAIHQCIITKEGSIQLNPLAAPGVRMERYGNFPNSQWHMKYHDRSKCVAVRTIDKVTMPALNTLRFRIVYLSQDSGETVNFIAEMRNVSNGAWLFSKPMEVEY